MLTERAVEAARTRLERDLLRPVHYDAAKNAVEAAISVLLSTHRNADREPSQAMLDAARDWSQKKYGKPIGNDAAIGCWQAMYDALAADTLPREAGTRYPLELDESEACAMQRKLK